MEVSYVGSKVTVKLKKDEVERQLGGSGQSGEVKSEQGGANGHRFVYAVPDCNGPEVVEQVTGTIYALLRKSPKDLNGKTYKIKQLGKTEEKKKTARYPRPQDTVAKTGTELEEVEFQVVDL